MIDHIKMLGIYLFLLACNLLLMFITFHYILNSYQIGQYQAKLTKMELQNQLDILDYQLAITPDQLELNTIKKFDRKYDSNIQAKIKHAYGISQSANFSQHDVKSGLQALRDDKNQQIQNIQARSFFSYIPEWQLLILGILGVIATKIINYIVDYVKACICDYCKRRTRIKKNIN